MRKTDNDQTVNWRSFYAAKMNTTADHIFYWWELIKEIQTKAKAKFVDGVIFQDTAMGDYVYQISGSVSQPQAGQQIIGRTLKYGNDFTKEIPF